MRTRNRGQVVFGIILILFGAFFLLVTVADRIFDRLEIGFEPWRLWPLILIIISIGFFLPIALAWSQRRQLAGLAVPGAIFLVNGLLLLYQSLSGNWESWAWAWTLEPIAVGLGLFLTYLLGERHTGLLIAAGIVGGIGVFFLVIFGTAFGGALIGIIAALLLIAIGLAVLLGAFRRPGSQG